MRTGTSEPSVLVVCCPSVLVASDRDSCNPNAITTLERRRIELELLRRRSVAGATANSDANEGSEAPRLDDVVVDVRARSDRCLGAGNDSVSFMLTRLAAAGPTNRLNCSRDMEKPGSNRSAGAPVVITDDSSDRNTDERRRRRACSSNTASHSRHTQ